MALDFCEEAPNDGEKDLESCVVCRGRVGGVLGLLPLVDQEGRVACVAHNDDMAVARAIGGGPCRIHTSKSYPPTQRRGDVSRHDLQDLLPALLHCRALPHTEMSCRHA